MKPGRKIDLKNYVICFSYRMPNVKKSKEDILEYQKLAQRRRRAKIKQDPARYAEIKEKDRMKYYRLKAENKIVPINDLSPACRDLLRKRNRDNFKAYYVRHKEKKVGKSSRKGIRQILHKMICSPTNEVINFYKFCHFCRVKCHNKTSKLFRFRSL